MTLVDFIGWLVMGTFLVTVISIYSQAYSCLWSRNNGKKWEPGTEGLSSAKFMARTWANVLWLIYALSVQPLKYPLIIGCSLILLGLFAILFFMLAFPPRRNKAERVMLILTLVVGATIPIFALKGLFPLGEQFFKALPWVAALALFAPGEVHQIVMLWRTGDPGRQSRFEAGWPVIDLAVWVVYGLILAAPEVWATSVIVGFLFLTRFLMLGRYRKVAQGG